MDTRWSPGPEEDPAAWLSGEAPRDPWATDYAQPATPHGYGAAPHSPAPPPGAPGGAAPPPGVAPHSPAPPLAPHSPAPHVYGTVPPGPTLHDPGVPHRAAPTEPVFGDLVDQGGTPGVREGWGAYPSTTATSATLHPGGYGDAPTRTVPSGPLRREVDREEPDGRPALRAPLSATLRWVAVWLVVPVLIYLLFAVTRSGTTPAGCLDAPGAPCLSPRERALSAFGRALPGLVATLALAVPVSLMLRRLANHWRAATVALAAMVMSAGAVTLLGSLFG